MNEKLMDIHPDTLEPLQVFRFERYTALITKIRTLVQLLHAEQLHDGERSILQEKIGIHLVEFTVSLAVATGVGSIYFFRPELIVNPIVQTLRILQIPASNELLMHIPELARLTLVAVIIDQNTKNPLRIIPMIQRAFAQMHLHNLASVVSRKQK